MSEELKIKNCLANAIANLPKVDWFPITYVTKAVLETYFKTSIALVLCDIEDKIYTEEDALIYAGLRIPYVSVNIESGDELKGSVYYSGNTYYFNSTEVTVEPYILQCYAPSNANAVAVT